MAGGQHPYFTSGLSWHVHLADGLAEAREHGLRIFLQHGHRLCSGTRALVERTLAKEEVAEVMAKHFVCVASDADQLEPDVAALIAQLPRKEPTPLCIYLDGDGRLLTSTAGGRPPAVLLNDMLSATPRR